MKILRLLLVGSLGVFALVGSGARGAEITNPASVGFDAVRLGRLDAVIQAQVDEKKIAGVVLYVARDGKEVRHRIAAGDHGDGVPATDLFRGRQQLLVRTQVFGARALLATHSFRSG